MNAIEIQKLIESNISDSQAIVTTDDNVHFDAIVISNTFKNITNRVAQQKLVYKALGNKISNGEIHALQLKTYTQDKWDTIK